MNEAKWSPAVPNLIQKMLNEAAVLLSRSRHYWKETNVQWIIRWKTDPTREKGKYAERMSMWSIPQSIWPALLPSLWIFYPPRIQFKIITTTWPWETSLKTTSRQNSGRCLPALEKIADSSLLRSWTPAYPQKAQTGKVAWWQLLIEVL